MNLQQTIDSACESFDEKFGTFITNNDYHSNQIKSHLISSIKKAVKEAYKAIKIEEKDDPWAYVYNIDMTVGYNNCVSLIENKKSEFLNK